jgi:hypothetical protein
MSEELPRAAGLDSESNKMHNHSFPAALAARRLSMRFWVTWTLLSALVGAALLFIIASAPAVVEESLTSIILALAPVILILGIAWQFGKRLLRNYFGDESGWLAASYYMTMFAVFLNLAAVGVALLLIPLGLRSRIRHVTRWTIACGLGGVLASIAVLYAPAYVSLEFAGFITLGVLAFALMAVITGVALRSMLQAEQ